MLAGYSPFYNEDKLTAYENILCGKIDFPRNFDSLSKDLVKKLLIVDRAKRLGCKVNHFKFDSWGNLICT